MRQRILSRLPGEIQCVVETRSQIRFDTQGLVERCLRILGDFARQFWNPPVELWRKLQISRSNVMEVVRSRGPELPGIARRQTRITRVADRGEVAERDFQRLRLISEKIIALHRGVRIGRSTAEVSLHG